MAEGGILMGLIVRLPWSEFLTGRPNLCLNAV